MQIEAGENARAASAYSILVIRQLYEKMLLFMFILLDLVNVIRFGSKSLDSAAFGITWLTAPPISSFACERDQLRTPTPRITFGPRAYDCCVKVVFLKISQH